MDVIMIGSCMLCAQHALDHGRYHGWAMDALFSPLQQIRWLLMHWFLMRAGF